MVNFFNFLSFVMPWWDEHQNLFSPPYTPSLGRVQKIRRIEIIVEGNEEVRNHIEEAITELIREIPSQSPLFQYWSGWFEVVRSEEVETPDERCILYERGTSLKPKQTPPPGG